MWPSPQWNFHPYGVRSRRDDPSRRSPFHDLNGFEYHPNWLHNLLKKNGSRWHLRPRAFAPQASVMASGVRDDVSHEYTCFMRRGEDARLHGRFIRSVQVHGPALVSGSGRQQVLIGRDVDRVLRSTRPSYAFVGS